ncbi:uroporphyrinogen-III C-methyltransferase [Mariniphaga anaerophila]|uniref:uroporphyrinogen-III C-methyltransferase n=1 Tax=Mariniphaga anaerophila TaxID=1484053 RepID=A0A1M5EZW2_9BACT|nr:uroporphyrinogen-III C-methyltransferase [Mariniphaga anaerophila]SHF84716.1 uroporphyrinogen-III C-methyltransferase [Mariniphaga anaerophila]
MGFSHLISIVGAGPGDPDLLTVKALDRLKSADVVLYDALVGDEMLRLVKPEAVKKYVGKLNADGQNPEERQNQIHRFFLYWAEKNKKVVRLKTGDSMIFGRGAEEIRFCKENGLNYEVIPGVTAGIAASSLFSVPLTERGKSHMLLFYTCRKENDCFPQLNPLLSVLKTGSPVVLYMGLSHLSELAEKLIENGISGEMPVQILCKISQPGQSGYTTSIARVLEFLEENKPCTPSLVIIGENAERI